MNKVSALDLDVEDPKIVSTHSAIGRRRVGNSEAGSGQKGQGNRREGLHCDVSEKSQLTREVEDMEMLRSEGKNVTD